MDFRRVRPADWLLAAAGALLLASLFLPWYGVESSATTSGFEALSVLDIVLALIGASAVAVVPITAAQAVPAVPLTVDALVTIAGLVAVVLVAIRLLDVPDFAASREWGLWLAMAAAAGTVAAGLAAMKDERGATVGSPDVERLPAPKAPA